MADATAPSLSVPAWPGSLTRFGTWAIALGVVLVALSGPTHRFLAIGFRVALAFLAVGVLVLLAGALLAILGFLVAQVRGVPVGRGVTALAILVALGVIGYLLSWLRSSALAPPIHEISTDLASPPPFVALLGLRQQAGAESPP